MQACIQLVRQHDQFTICLKPLFNTIWEIFIAILAPVSTQSRADAVIESLTTYICYAGLEMGARLPSERDLAADLGVSRPILREALKHLAALGIVEAKTGSGTYLRKLISPSDQHIVMKLESELQTLLQLIQLRRALESEAAALTALNATEEQIDELECLVDALEKEHFEQGNATETDKAFHLALYKFSGNPLFFQIIEPLWEAVEKLWVRPLFGKQHIGHRTLEHHREAFNHIRDRDANGARQTILAMLELVEEDLITYPFA